MEHLHALPSQLDLDPVAKRELMAYHRLHGRAQNACSDCSKKMRNETRLCFWCGNFYTDEGNYSWMPSEDEMGDGTAATAIGAKRLPKPAARRVEDEFDRTGHVDVGTDTEAAGRALGHMFGQSQEQKQANVDAWMEKLRAKGVVTDEPSITR